MTKNRKLASASRLLLILVLLSTFNTAFAEWKLLQNSPTTNDLHSVFFIDDNTGWIAGDNSTIYKTTNSGESWVPQTSPEASNFQCIIFVSANTGWACGTGGVVIKTTNGGTNWISQTFTGVKFNSMDFIDSNTGYICGNNGIIWKTINGGSNWVNQPTGRIENLHKIKVYSNGQIGFAVGDYAIILKTTDGGSTWDKKSGPGIGGQIFYSIASGLNFWSAGTLMKSSSDEGNIWNLEDFPVEPLYSYIAFAENTYYGVGANGYIVKTIVGSTNTTQEQSPTSQNLYSVYMPGPNLIWAVGANGTIIKYISDWNIIRFPESYLYAIDFVNKNTGWAVGKNGYIEKITNGGTNWTSQYSGILNRLNSVCFTDINTGYVVGDSGTIIKTTNSGIDWIAQHSNTTFDLHSVCFTDANTGYAVGRSHNVFEQGGKLLKTIDGGNLWTTQVPEPTHDLMSVYFVGPDTGYAVGYYSPVLKTIDKGTTWSAQNLDSLYYLNSVYFISVDTGYAVGSRTILKTTNGGINWITMPIPVIDDFYSVFFIDANSGYINSANGIYKTSNGGTNWYREELPFVVNGGIKAINFVVENDTAFGFAAGNWLLGTKFYIPGSTYGNSGSYPGWVPVNSGTFGTLRGVDFINPFVAFAVGDPFDFFGTEKGLILRTINGGQTWTRQQSNDATAYLNDISFADVNNGIAVGGKGVILHTTNGGADWVQQTSGTTYMLDAVDMLDVNNAFACGGCNIIGCGNTNTLLHTSDGGESWQMQTNGTSGYWHDIDYIDSTTATAVGIQGKIIRTTNAGLTWSPQTGGRNLNLSGVRFFDVNNGIVISFEGPVLRTTDGGTNWVQTDSLSGSPEQINYADANNAFIVSLLGGVGLIYHSTNGGLNWTLQETTNTPVLTVSFADANNGLAAGTNGAILRTSNGGGAGSGTLPEYKRGGLNIPINDFESANDSINITISHKSSRKDVVARLYLTIDSVFHTNDGDLEFYLEHNGITDTVIYRNGEGGENFLGTFLNDDTNYPLVSGTAPFRGSFEPYRSLSKFNGQDAEGYWKLRIYDRAAGNTGTLQAWSLSIIPRSVEGTTDVTTIPAQNLLSRNYPNPFYTNTTIEFGLLKPSYVTLKIYNIRGQEVETLINTKCQAGQNTVQWDAGEFAGGVYFYRLQVGNQVETKKLFLIK